MARQVTTAKTAAKGKAPPAAPVAPRAPSKAAARAAAKPAPAEKPTKTPAKAAAAMPAEAPAKPAAPATVTLKHLAAGLAERHDMQKREAEAVVADVFGRVVDHLKAGERVRIGGLGIIEVKDRPARMGRNHPGRAAQNGMVSALLAQQGFTASEVAIEGFDGWGQALSTRHDWSEATDGLGQHYELALNTYKPFACGIVSHPAIDAAIQLRNANGLQPDMIQAIDLRVHPLVLNLMGKTDPRAGLEGKFSIHHAVAVAVVTGRAGEQAFTDRAVADPAVVAVRRRVTATTDPAIKAD